MGMQIYVFSGLELITLSLCYLKEELKNPLTNYFRKNSFFNYIYHQFSYNNNKPKGKNRKEKKTKLRNI